MFSIFSSGPQPGQQTFFPVTDAFPANKAFGELVSTDTEWLCAGGFVTETQVWYNVLEDGTWMMCQVIHSSIGLWSPTIQFTSKVYNPNTKEATWKSVNVSNFKTPPPPSGGVTYDKRSCKADEFTIIHKSNDNDPNAAESYTITANLGKELQITVVISRAASVPGWKFGKGPTGGFSNFGHDQTKKEGYVVHRFWPRTEVNGHIIVKGKAINAHGPGVFIHAIQGMRPNLVASRWNFANFQSNQHGGISGIQMEFTTLDQFGPKGAGSGGVKVNVGSLVVGGKLVAVTGETTLGNGESSSAVGMKSRAAHPTTEYDPDTKYNAPTKIVYEWAGPSIAPGVESDVQAKLELDCGSPNAPNGLIEKVDVLAEIPKAVKAVVSYVTGAKPYIYQYLNGTTLELTCPASLVGGEGNEPQTVSVHGSLFNEASFVS